MKLKSITTQITLLFGVLMFVICTGLGICAYLNSSNALKASIDENLLEIAEADAKVIAEKVNAQLNALQALAETPWIKSSELSIGEKIALLQDEVKRSGHKTIMLADAIASALPRPSEYVYERQSVRRPRGKNEIGISAIRGGTIVGEHEVIFAGPDEVIEFSHKAYSREVFASGAITAAKFLAGVTEPGMYDMNDALAEILSR